MSFFPRKCKEHEFVCEDKYMGGFLDQAWNDTSLELILYITYQPHATPSSHECCKISGQKENETDDQLVSLLYQQR